MKSRIRFRPRVEELEGRLVPASLTYSTNWSGYAVTTSAGQVSQVAGSWVVPTVSSSVSGYSSAWVGIDGFNSSTVEQIGTDSDYVGGHAYYYAWYEMYPAGSVNLSLAVNAGDTISASVSYSGSNTFALSIKDVTTNQSMSFNKTSSQAQRSSAEWIQEAPSSYSGVLPLANFGTINFSGASATVGGTAGPADNGWSSSTLYQIDMVTNTGTAKATPSALSDSGSSTASSFSVTWDSSGVSSGTRSHHRSANMPASSAAFVLSAPGTGLGTSHQAVPSALPVSPPPATVVLPTGVGLATSPASSAITATVAPDANDLDDQGADQANGSAWSFPGGSAERWTEGLGNPQAQQTSDHVPGTSPVSGWGGDATCPDGFWLPAAALESAADSLNGADQGGAESGDY
jgi:hypothetical protein